MAGVLIGKAFLSSTVNLLVNKMASPEVWDFFRGRKLDQLRNKLEIKMISINNVLDDAEDKQHTNPYVKRWHDKLKDAVYEAEDLLDEIATKVERSKMEAESQTTLDKVQDFASSLNPFKTEKLEDILETLQHLIDQINALGLKPGIEKSSYQRPPTTSIPDELDIYGRDADKEAIMKWMRSDDPNNSNPGVLAIVGFGGLGKTTLAQDVYRDSDWFDKKTWVYVSEEFNVSKLTKDILQGFTKQSSNTDNLDQLQNLLKEDLTGKKFLLVLDDVWNKDYLMWQDLLKSLRSGSKGSKILVTTQDAHVAKIMQTSPSYLLKKLEDDDCWLLFERHAFNGTGSSSAHRELERIGRQLIKKCDGLPLAAKVLGGALRSERDPKEWENILESDTWNLNKDRIVIVLKMSYQFLPSHLKRCFAYCAVFPKGYEFKKERLIRFWMAEGFLTQPKGNIQIEEVEKAGEVCFNDLVSRSLFQQSMEREYFLMHDLINDLARYISGEFCFRIGVDRSCKITERIRHLWFQREAAHEFHNQIITMKHLRTFLYMEWASLNNIEMQNFLSTFTRLRVLSLISYNQIHFPDSFGQFIHLRHLDFSYSLIERLPDSVVSLSNLEILILCGCRNLVELPAKISKLINLCQLDIRGTKVRKMPPHMGKLKKLGELAHFIVGKESDCSIKELGPLNRLRGHLRIEGLKNVSKVEESVEANLKSKEKLKGLELIWGDEGSEDSLHERNVLEKLQPHANIEQLEIDGYAGMRFPDWVGDSSFSNMVELKLIRCRYCLSLPPSLGQLESLKRLTIKELDAIKVVGTEFYGNGNKPPFGHLQYLRFEKMSQWEEWVPYKNMDEGGHSFTSFPLLESLVIVECPNLKEIQPLRLPSLTILEIKRCDRLASLPRAPAIQKFEINDEDISRCMTFELSPYSRSPSLRVWRWDSDDSPLEILEQMLEYPNSIGLEKLLVEDCRSLMRFPLDLFPMLESLEINRCPILESPFLSAASQEEQPLQCFKSLKLDNCPKLKWLPGCIVPSLMELEIRSCPSVAIVNWLRLFPNLTKLCLAGSGEGSWYEGVESFSLESMFLPPTLTSRDFPNLKSLDNEGLQSLTSLTKLRISCCPNLVSLLSLQSLVSLRELEISWCPNLREVSLPPTLTSLEILYLRNMESLDDWGLHRLASLTQLQISNCRKLQSLPKEGLPSSLQLVDIDNCPLLQLGQDWPFNPPRRWL